MGYSVTGRDGNGKPLTSIEFISFEVAARFFASLITDDNVSSATLTDEDTETALGTFTRPEGAR